ncbi:MAG: DUF1922 domain-containing protein [Candidatus Bathyarchaeota archaeon]|nr:DUF1922 domain-containing protein [Candidatus Bathyarchaeota archaeon]
MMFKCSSCGKVNMVKAGQKSKHCVFCGLRNNLAKVRILALASTLNEAKEKIKSLKSSE